jgi:ATP-dependent RNA helicase DeaD
MTPDSLCEFIQGETGESNLKIMDAEIFPHFSFVTLPFAQAEALLEVFKDKKKGRKPFVEIAQKSKGKISKDTNDSRSTNNVNNAREMASRRINNKRETGSTKRKHSSY